MSATRSSRRGPGLRRPDAACSTRRRAHDGIAGPARAPAIGGPRGRADRPDGHPRRGVGRAPGRAAPGRPGGVAGGRRPGPATPARSGDGAAALRGRRSRDRRARRSRRRTSRRSTATRCAWSSTRRLYDARRRAWPARRRWPQLVADRGGPGQPLRPRPAGPGDRRPGPCPLGPRRARRCRPTPTPGCPGASWRSTSTSARAAAEGAGSPDGTDGANAAAMLIDAADVVTDVRMESVR